VDGPRGCAEDASPAIRALERQTSLRFRLKGEPPLKLLSASPIISGRSLPPATEHFDDLGD
jgi:hypothetical protein